MSEYTNQESDAANMRERSAEREGRAEHATDTQGPNAQDAANAPRLATSPTIAGRGNGPVRASTMLTMQQTHGNRAIQRAFDFGSPFNPGSFLPPKPAYKSNPYPSASDFPPNPYGPSDPSIFNPSSSPWPYGPPDSGAPFPPNPYGPSMEGPAPFENSDDYPSGLEDGEEFA